MAETVKDKLKKKKKTGGLVPVGPAVDKTAIEMPGEGQRLDKVGKLNLLSPKGAKRPTVIELEGEALEAEKTSGLSDLVKKSGKPVKPTKPKIKPKASWLKSAMRASPLLAGVAIAAGIITADDDTEAPAEEKKPEQPLPEAPSKEEEKQEENKEQEYFNQYEKTSEKFEKELAKLDSRDAAELRRIYDQLNKDKEEARKLYKEARKRAEWGEIAENLAKQLAMFGAAMEGYRTGVDISSGLKFSPTDYRERYRELRQDLNDKVSDLKGKARQDIDVYKAQTETSKEAIRKRRSAALQDLNRQFQLGQKRAAEARKKEKTKEKQQAAIEQEINKVNNNYREIDNKIADVLNEENESKQKKMLEKIYPKIREAAGLTEEAMRKGATKIEKGWIWDTEKLDAKQLRQFMEARRKATIQGLGGRGNPRSAPVKQAPTKPVTAKELPEI